MGLIVTSRVQHAVNNETYSGEKGVRYAKGTRCGVCGTTLRQAKVHKGRIEDLDTRELGFAVRLRADPEPKPEVKRLAGAILSRLRKD